MISGPRVIGCITDKSQLNQFNAKSGDMILQPNVYVSRYEGRFDYIWMYVDGEGWLVMSRTKVEAIEME